MSTPTFKEGQEVSFGLNDGTFTDKGFLDGQIVRVVEARYGKMDIPAQYQDPKNPYPPRIAAKLIFSIKKQDGTEKVLKAQEYSTGIQWDGEDSTATVSADGKRLVAKKGFKGFGKQTDFYHLLETAINSGFAEDGFKGDISVFDGLEFLMVSEPNPRAGKNSKTGEGPKPKPFFGLLQNGGNAAVGKPVAASTTQATPTLDPAILAAGVQAITAMVSESATNSVTRRDVASKVPPIADSNGWDVATRTGVMQALFDLPKLQIIVNAAGLKLNGETVSA